MFTHARHYGIDMAPNSYALLSPHPQARFPPCANVCRENDSHRALLTHTSCRQCKPHGLSRGYSQVEQSTKAELRIIVNLCGSRAHISLGWRYELYCLRFHGRVISIKSCSSIAYVCLLCCTKATQQLRKKKKKKKLMKELFLCSRRSRCYVSHTKPTHATKF